MKRDFMTSEPKTPLDYTILKVTLTIAVPHYGVESSVLVDASSWVTIDGDAIMLGLTEEPLTLS
jgi:hypothetical protein